MSPQDTGPDKPETDEKVTLTVSTIEAGDYTHDYSIHHELEVVVKRTTTHLKLVGASPWILEHNGAELPLTETIKHAKLKDGDVLTLSGEEGGGGSSRF